MTNLDSIWKSRSITLPTKMHLVKAMVFASSHVWMWELDNKNGWKPKNWCFSTVVLQKTLGNPLDCKVIKPVNPKENQPWIFIGRIGAEAKAPNTLATWWEEQTHWKRPWGQERLKAWVEEDYRGWMASLTQWARVWANSGRWCRTGKPGVLQSTVSTESVTTEQLNNNKGKAGTCGHRSQAGAKWVAFLGRSTVVFLSVGSSKVP